MRKHNKWLKSKGMLLDENGKVIEGHFNSFTAWGCHDAYICSKCKRIFVTPWTLKEHLAHRCKGICRLKHPNLYACSLCKQKCHLKINLEFS